MLPILLALGGIAAAKNAHDHGLAKVRAASAARTKAAAKAAAAKAAAAKAAAAKAAAAKAAAEKTAFTEQTLSIVTVAKTATSTMKGDEDEARL